MTNSPMVDVAIVSYNHEKYIAQAIESVLMQKTDFKVRMIIGDDCSSDRTQQIIGEYVQKYPDRIKTILFEKNIGIFSKDRVGIKVLEQCTDKYIAMLDGDDYWTDPLKLQKQVDFLETHPDCSLCFHESTVIDEITDKEYMYLKFIPRNRTTFYLEDILKFNFIPTNSVVYRNGLIKKFPDWYFEMYGGDTGLFVLLAQKGNIGFINEVMSAYRRHGVGSWSGLKSIERLLNGLNNHEVLDAALNYRYSYCFKEAKAKSNYLLARELRKLGKNKEAKRAFLKSLKNVFPNKFHTSPLNYFKLFMRLYFPKITSRFSV